MASHANGGDAAMRTIAVKAPIPVGLSRWKDLLDTGWQFRLPVFIWHSTRTDVMAPWNDYKRTGWWAFNVLIKRQPHGMGLRWGWMLVKATDGCDIPSPHSGVPWPRWWK
jgi:hypothetical protein